MHVQQGETGPAQFPPVQRPRPATDLMAPPISNETAVTWMTLGVT